MVGGGAEDEGEGRGRSEELLAAMGELEPGHRLGKYELLLPVARGGMALVWAGREAGEAGALVAIKTMLPALGGDPRFRRFFLREARIASRISSPHVCAVLDSGASATTLYLAMEWIDGEPLSRLLAVQPARRLRPRTVALIGREVALGLGVAHALTDGRGAHLGVVHRDVSPQNILVGYDGIARISDFGLAKATRATDQDSQSGHLKGKVDYLSPEQVYSEEVDGRSDVFALGAVIYETSTGRRPFAAETQVGTLVKISSPEPAPDPRALVADYPAALANVVRKALAKDPAQRFSTMDDLAAALAEVATGLGGGDVHSAMDEARHPVWEQRRAAIAEALQRRPEGAGRTTAPAPGATRAVDRRRRPRRYLAVGALAAALAAFAGAYHSRQRRAAPVATPVTAAPPREEAAPRRPAALPAPAPIPAPASGPPGSKAAARRRTPTPRPAPRPEMPDEEILGTRE